MKTFILLLGFAASCLASIPVKNVDSVRDSFADETITKIVSQINKEQQASYFYQAYSKYFKRGDVALDGFAKWFSTAAKEEHDHAEKLMDYLNKRGGQMDLNDVVLQDVCNTVSTQLASFTQFGRSEACICNFMARNQVHTDDECVKDHSKWFSGLQAMQDALVLERYVNDALLTLHQETSTDAHFGHMLEHEFLGEQVDSIKQYADYITILNRVESGLGEYEFDKTLQ